MTGEWWWMWQLSVEIPVDAQPTDTVQYGTVQCMSSRDVLVDCAGIRAMCVSIAVATAGTARHRTASWGRHALPLLQLLLRSVLLTRAARLWLFASTPIRLVVVDTPASAMPPHPWLR